MKCDYCQGEDHLESACGKRKGERTFTVALGCLFILLLTPFLVAGAVLGAISSAFMEGFRDTADLWQKTLKRVRERRDDEPTV